MENVMREQKNEIQRERTKRLEAEEMMHEFENGPRVQISLWSKLNGLEQILRVVAILIGRFDHRKPYNYFS